MRFKFIVILMLLLVAFVTPSIAQNLNGLQVVNYKHDGVSVVWTSVQATTGTVFYRPYYAGNDNEPWQQATDGQLAEAHLVNITGLEMASNYEMYAVSGGSQSDRIQFNTASAAFPPHTPVNYYGFVIIENSPEIVEGALILIQAHINGQSSHYLATKTNENGAWSINAKLFKSMDEYPEAFNDNNNDGFPDNVQYSIDVHVDAGSSGQNNLIGYPAMIDYTEFPTVELDGPPAAPLNVTAVAGDRQATVTWAYDEYNGNEEYFLLFSRTAEEWTFEAEIPAVIGQATYSTNVEDLMNGTPYQFAVSVVNDINYQSDLALSDWVTPFDITGPGAAVDFTATASENFVTLCWTNPTDADFSGSVVRYSNTDYPTMPAGAGSGLNVGDFWQGDFNEPGVHVCHVHPTGPNEVEYFYSIFTYDDENPRNYGDRVIDSATPGDYIAPGSLIDFIAEPVFGQSSINVNWINPDDDDYQGALILRKVGNEFTPADEQFFPDRGVMLTVGQVLPNGIEVIAITDETTTEIIDPGLADGVMYYYAGLARDEVPNYAPAVFSGTQANPHPDFDINNNHGNVGENEISMTVTAGGNPVSKSMLVVNPYDNLYNFDPWDGPGNETLINVGPPGLIIELVNEGSGTTISGVVDIESTLEGNDPQSVPFTVTAETGAVGGEYTGWVVICGTGQYSGVTDCDSVLAVVEVVGAQESINIIPATSSVTVEDGFAGGSFTVNNTGNSVLDDLSITSNGFPGAWVFNFTPSSITQLTLPGSVVVNFTVQLSTAYLAGMYTGNIVVADDDGAPTASEELTVVIEPTPMMSITPDPVEITVSAGDNASETIIVHNDGNVHLESVNFADLTLTRVGGGSTLDLAIDGILTIPYGSTANRAVTVSTGSDVIGGLYTGTVTAAGYASGDPDNTVSTEFVVNVNVIDAMQDLNIVENTLAVSGNPGQTVQAFFNVENTGHDDLEDITFALTDLGFDVDFAPSELDIPWSLTPEPYQVIANITIAENAAAGDYVGTIWAAHVSNDPSDTVELTVTVNSMCDWILDNYPLNPLSLNPGDELISSFQIENTGNNVIENIEIPSPIYVGNGSQAFPVVIGEYLTTLNMGQIMTVPMSITVPDDAVAAIYSGAVVVSGECNAEAVELSFALQIDVQLNSGWSFSPLTLDFGDREPGEAVTSTLTIENTGNCAIEEIQVNTINLINSECASAIIPVTVNIDVDMIAIGDSEDYDVDITVPANACAGTYVADGTFEFQASACGIEIFNSSVSALVTVVETCDISFETANFAYTMNHNDADAVLFAINNDGNSDIDVTFSVEDLPASFMVDYSVNPLNIAAGTTGSVTITVSAPVGQLAAEYDMTVVGSAMGCTNIDLNGNVTILPTTDLDLSSTTVEVDDVAPGESDTGTIMIINPNSVINNQYDPDDGPANEGLENVEISAMPLLMEGTDTVFDGSLSFDVASTLASGDDMLATITVTASESALNGVYSTHVTVSGTGAVSQDAVSETFMLYVTVGSIPCISLSGLVDLVGDPDESVSGILVVENCGNRPLTGITLSETFNDFDLAFGLNNFTLAVDEIKNIPVSVVLPNVGALCAGTYEGQIQAATNEGEDGNFAFSIIVNPVYDFEISSSSLTFTGADSENIVKQLEIVNTGNVALTGFSASFADQSHLTGVDSGLQIPDSHVIFDFVDIACHGAQIIDVSVHIPDGQTFDDYIGRAHLTCNNDPFGVFLDMTVQVQPDFAISASWAEATPAGVIDGLESVVGTITVENQGNDDLYNINLLIGDGFRLAGTNIQAIGADRVTFQPAQIGILLKGESRDVVVRVTVPAGIMNGEYHANLAVVAEGNLGGSAETTLDVFFTVTDSREYSVGPNPVHFPDNRAVNFYFPSGRIDGIKIYNMAAELVRELPVGSVTQLSWDLMNDEGNEVASGMYVCLLVNGDEVISQQKVMVVKSGN